MDVDISIRKKYLFFREDARAILKRILAKKGMPRNVYLDFLGVTFFSRSFIDELLNIVDVLRKEMVTVRMVNLKPKLKILLRRVQKTKSAIQKTKINKFKKI